MWRGLTHVLLVKVVKKRHNGVIFNKYLNDKKVKELITFGTIAN
jgi:hypothetical protein